MIMRSLKLKVKLGIDLATITIFLFNVFTGFAMFLRIVTGGGRQYSGVEGFNVASLANLSTGAWYRAIHDWSGIIVVVLMLTHLILNWKTLMCYLRNVFKSVKITKIAKIPESCENN
jgi:hypothetical protein